MADFAIIPVAPIFLAEVDFGESALMRDLRGSIETLLQTHRQWALPLVELPPLAGLGGWGIDRGIDTRTGQLLDGDDWVNAVEALDQSERQVCEDAHPAIAVALLHAHGAGVDVGPLGSSESLLIPIDLSAAASDEAPLAPVAGAADFDESVVAALRAGDVTPATTGRAPGDTGTDADASRGPSAEASGGSSADAVHADVRLLDAAADHIAAEGRSFGPLRVTFDEVVHHVRSVCGIGSL